MKSALTPIIYICTRIFYTILAWLVPSKRKKTMFVAETNLPTDKGIFRVRSYRRLGTPDEPIAIVYGKVEGLANVHMRVHDACFTSEVLGSKKCDCKEQLDYSMHYIRNHNPGIVIYLQQEGRGIGLSNKIAAYSLQEAGYDTVEANRLLGLPDDSRNYDPVLDILQDLNVKSVKLMTNNPRKIEELRKLGIDISDRVPVHIAPNTVNEGYLRTKAEKMQHFLDLSKFSISNCSPPPVPLITAKSS
jgi:GTP cyclohydrolase II